MSNKVVKSIAICLALFLISLIISFVVSFAYYFASSLGLTKEEVIVADRVDESLNLKGIKDVEFNLKYASFVIKTGDELKIETSNKDIVVSKNQGKLVVSENSRFFKKNKEQKLVFSIPMDYKFDRFAINSKAQEINIDSLYSEIVEFDLGACKLDIDYIYAAKKILINGGVGTINILDGKLNNLDLELGTGKTSINAYILGDSDIEAGIGEISLNLKGSLEDYSFDVEKGIGSIKLNDNSLSNDSKVGNGINKIDIEGGIGAINIKVDE